MLGLPALRERPDAPVIVMEGERKRDLAEPFLPDHVCLSVYGGAVSGLQADLSPLRSRNVIWWPDADQAGVALMMKLAARADTATSQIVSTKGLPAGWDAGDLAESAGASAATFAEWLAPRLTRPEPPAAVPDDRPAPKAAPRPVEPAPDRPARSAAGGATVTPIRAKKPDPVEDAEPGMPPEYSDDHLADQFAERFSDRFCYVAEAGEWRIWEEGRWRADRSLRTRETIRVQICRAAGMEAMSRTELGAKGQRIAGTLGSARTTGSVDTMARGDRRLAKTLEDFDADLDAINTPAGLVNLRTGEIRPTRPSDYVSRITRASPSGKCPEWLRFLNRTQAGETPDITRENIAFLKRWAGYCMTGDTSEQKFVFFHGPGAAGKGTFINTISWILGDYATSTPMETFTKKTRDGDNGIPADLADLKTARMVTSQETEEGKRWNEQRIKMATGEDAIKARFMRANFFEYQPRFKLLFAGNHRPQLDNVDVAIKRRLILVPFENAVPAGEQDMGLKDRLRAEADGIMQWMLEGCLEWRQYGLRAPEEIMGATAEYFEDQDVPRQFIAECVDMSDRACRVSAGALYGRYVDWCERVGEKPRDMRRFLDSMVENGIRRAPRGRIVEGGQVRAGVAIMVGARLLDPRMRDDSDAFG
jgi:P4 family phage/plasmid primase-like protien